MINIRLSELLAERQLSLYQLSKETGIRYATLWLMSRNELVLINLKILGKICEQLACGPGELLELTPKPRSQARRKKTK